MYSILISAAAALLVGAAAYFGLDSWFAAIGLGLVTFLVIGILIVRRVGNRLQPELNRVRKNAEARHLDTAAEILESLLPLAKWVPGLTGQLRAQAGAIIAQSDEAKARTHLESASRRNGDAQLLLASIAYRAGDTTAALDGLKAAAPYNRKHSLFNNTYAFLLNKEGRTGEAIAQLNVFLKKAPDHEATKNNLLRLQNGQKMSMRDFGNEWWALRFENPPASLGEVQMGRKGFRQPPKRPKQQKQQKQQKKKKKKR